MDYSPTVTPDTLKAITADDLKEHLLNGEKVQDLLPLCEGQDCEIFKGDFFGPADAILYIPDIYLNEIPVDRPATKEEIAHIIDHCYSRSDFIHLCDGDVALAYRLFCYCDWQNPSSALPEVGYDDDDDKAFAESMLCSAQRRSGADSGKAFAE